MARNHIQKKARLILSAALLIEKIILGINSIIVNVARTKIIEYSAIKINANPTDAYSTLNPDTSSDSPSAKSKGVRLVSAIIEITHINIKSGIIIKNKTW